MDSQRPVDGISRYPLFFSGSNALEGEEDSDDDRFFFDDSASQWNLECDCPVHQRPSWKIPV
jgi:hypothetical protein